MENLPPAVVTDVENPDLRCLKVMVGIIHLHFAQKLTLAQIAASGAVGQSKCCKLFMRFLNQTPMAYVNQYRLYQSLELLRDTAMVRNGDRAGRRLWQRQLLRGGFPQRL